MVCAPQTSSLELTHMAAAVPMQGYDEGKVVNVHKAVQGQGHQIMEAQEELGVEKADGWMVEDHERGGAVLRVLDEAAMMQVLLKASSVYH